MRKKFHKKYHSIHFVVSRLLLDVGPSLKCGFIYPVRFYRRKLTFPLQVVIGYSVLVRGGDYVDFLLSALDHVCCLQLAAIVFVSSYMHPSHCVWKTLFHWCLPSHWFLWPCCLLFHIAPWALSGGVWWKCPIRTECSKIISLSDKHLSIP